MLCRSFIWHCTYKQHTWLPLAHLRRLFVLGLHKFKKPRLHLLGNLCNRDATTPFKDSDETTDQLDIASIDLTASYIVLI
jgi:hypothetical protein